MAIDDDFIAKEFKPFFQELGLALFVCQSFESSLCLLHAMMAHIENNGKERAFGRAWDFHSSKTLGRVVGLLQERIDMPADLKEYLECGVNFRNQIVHGFVAKNMHRLFEFEGLQEVHKKLENLRREVKSRDVLINKLLDALFSKYGFSNSDLKRQVGNLCLERNKSFSGRF